MGLQIALAVLVACNGTLVGPQGNDGEDGVDAGSQPGEVDGGPSADSRPSTPPPDGWCQDEDTVLGNLAAGLSSGEWAELPANSALDGVDYHYHLVTWLDNGVWNPIERSVQWIGGPGSCCADPAAYKMIRYDDEVMWLGAGNSGVRRHNRLTPDLEYTQLTDAPVILNSNGESLKTYDPQTGLFIVRNNNDDTWWEYDILADSWSETTSKVRADRPASWDNDASVFGTAIDDCGVLFFFTDDVGSGRRAYI